MIWTAVFSALAVMLYLTQPFLGLRALKKVFGICFFLQLFYLIGYYYASWPFPGPIVILQIIITVSLGAGLGAAFSKIWPLPPQAGIERVIRTILLVIPSIGLGIGLQILLQGAHATQAVYLIFALSSWLGSSHFIAVKKDGEPVLPAIKLFSKNKK